MSVTSQCKLYERVDFQSIDALKPEKQEPCLVFRNLQYTFKFTFQVNILFNIEGDMPMRLRTLTTGVHFLFVDEECLILQEQKHNMVYHIKHGFYKDSEEGEGMRPDW